MKTNRKVTLNEFLVKNKESLLREIEREIMGCRKCDLYKYRTNTVPGSGSFNATVMLIGEAPGFWEDKKGEPFVGRAGKFLDELLSVVGKSRREVFITNVVKCRPPNNREPTEEEIKACTPYLDKQIEIIKPKVIITLGRVSTSHIFKKFGLKVRSMREVHGKVFEIDTMFGKIRIVPMYHPATALYNPRMRNVLIEDWKSIEGVISEL